VTLLLTAFLLFQQAGAGFGLLEAFWCFACVAAGAWIMVLPFLREFQAEADLTEARELAASVEKISSVDAVAKQIADATEQWLHVEDRANEINAASREIAGKINAEAREFTEFLQKANDTEKNHLRLEVDKLNRAQVDWVKVVTGMLDHVFALNQAGRQSGQEKLVRQLDNFQVACRDVARRVGVVTYEPKPEEGFDTGKHQLRDPEAEPEVGAKIIGIAAQGLSHQGQVLRKAVVVIEGEEPGQAPPDASKPKAKAKAKKKA
jgi:molecular chaperone GrpE (heat shock protein)